MGVRSAVYVALGNNPSVGSVEKISVRFALGIAYTYVIVAAFVVQKAYSYLTAEISSLGELIETPVVVFDYAFESGRSVDDALFAHVVYLDFLLLSVNC